MIIYNEAFLKSVYYLINASPERQRKLHILGYDDPEYVEKKLKEIERKNHDFDNELKDADLVRRHNSYNPARSSF